MYSKLFYLYDRMVGSKSEEPRTSKNVVLIFVIIRSTEISCLRFEQKRSLVAIN